MTDRLEDDSDHSPDDARDWFAHIVATEGLRIAYNTAVSICQDPKAPAPAKATAVTAILRAAGAFDREKEGGAVEPHNMSGAQLAREIDRLRKRYRQLQGAGDNGVFN